MISEYPLCAGLEEEQVIECISSMFRKRVAAGDILIRSECMKELINRSRHLVYKPTITKPSSLSQLLDMRLHDTLMLILHICEKFNWSESLYEDTGKAKKETTSMSLVRVGLKLELLSLMERKRQSSLTMAKELLESSRSCTIAPGLHLFM